MSQYLRDYRVLVTSPKDDAVFAWTPLERFFYDLRESEPGIFGATVAADAWIYSQEENPENPIQLNSQVVVQRLIVATVPDWDTARVVWRGSVEEAEGVDDADATTMQFGAISKMGQLLNALASINGARLGTMSSPTIDIDTAALFCVLGSQILSEWAYFPADSNTDVWIPQTLVRASTTLDTTISAIDTTIIATVASGGFDAYGFIKIGSEVIWYDGYQNDGPGGKYRFLNCVRGCCSTTAAIHLATAAITQRKLATIAANRACYLEKQAGSGSASAGLWLPLAEYEPVATEGYFGLTFDALSFKGSEGGTGSPPWVGIRGTYAVYQHDPKLGAITLGLVLRALLTEPKANGGPEWVEGLDFAIDDIWTITDVDTGTNKITISGLHAADIDATGSIWIVGGVANDGEYVVSTVLEVGDTTEIVVTTTPPSGTTEGYVSGRTGIHDTTAIARFQIIKPTNLFAAIRSLYTQQSLSVGGEDDSLVIAEDPATGIVHFKLAQQSTDPDNEAVEIGLIRHNTRRRSLEDVFTDICVSFQTVLKTNLLASDRTWHKDASDTIGDNADAVIALAYQLGDNDEEKANTAGVGWIEEPLTSHQQRTELMFDSNSRTALMIESDDTTQPRGTGFEPFVFWLPNADPTVPDVPRLTNINKVELLMDFAWTGEGVTGGSTADDEATVMHFECLGLTDAPGLPVDFTTDPPTYDPAMFPTGNVVRLAALLEQRYRNKPRDYGNFQPFTKVQLVAEDIGVNIKGVLPRWANPPTRKLDSNAYSCMAIRDIRVEGPEIDSVLVSLTDQADSSGQFRYYPDTFAKLRNAHSAPRVLCVDIGRASPGVATSIGRALLGLSLLIFETETSQAGSWLVQPRPGLDTARLLDVGAWNGQEYEWQERDGFVTHIAVQVEDGAEEMDITTRNYFANRIGVSA